MRLTDDRGTFVVSAISDAEGGFRLRAPGPGGWRLDVERIGYQPQVREFSLEDGTAESIEIRLVPEPIELEPLGATVDMGARPPRCVSQFVLGQVLDDAAGEPVRGALGAMLVAETPQVVSCTSGGWIVFSKSPRCHGVIFVDGRRGSWMSRPLDYLSAADLEAVEVLRYPHVPREYWLPEGQPCAVLAAWTRERGGRSPTDPGESSSRDPQSPDAGAGSVPR